MKAQGSNDRQRNIHPRPCRGDKHHADTRIVKCAKIDRHRLGVAKQEWRSRQQQKAGQKDRAKRVYMPERIETDASQPGRRLVTKEARNISVGSFVKSDGDQNRQQPYRNGVK